MTVRINIPQLRADAELAVAGESDGYVLSAQAFDEAVLALVEAVEAAHALAWHLIEKADYPPDDAELLWPLNGILERFDFDPPQPKEQT